ncbi:MAG: L-serine ammonia-lyase [Myxococcota bacterium]
MAFISTFDLFRVGVGPSSSHTVGPMRAAATFLDGLKQRGLDRRVHRIEVRLIGSLAHTGRGHRTDHAALWGLSGQTPEEFDAARGEAILEAAYVQGKLSLGLGFDIPFSPERDLIFDLDAELTVHPNEIRFSAHGRDGLLWEQRYFSIGGGFISTHDGAQSQVVASIEERVPFPFTSAAQLLEHTRAHQISIAEVVKANELTVQSLQDMSDRIQKLYAVMVQCIERGISTTGILPGGLQVRRRAPELYRRLLAAEPVGRGRPSAPDLDWVHMWAMAVNEENAAGGQVVTAPTNGAAGIIPAVLQYCHRFVFDGEVDPAEVNEVFLFTAAAIGILFKRNASISGAEVGCQGEVGAASSMAAAGLCAVRGGTPQQVENAAEIAIEHSLGMTCDPVNGLVQVPCIERNGFGAAKAISAARLALLGDGVHHVSLDQAIRTMRQTGLDMSSKYKETSLGGLAVTFTEC